MKNREKGFTLVELMMIVVILGLSVALFSILYRSVVKGNHPAVSSGTAKRLETNLKDVKKLIKQLEAKKEKALSTKKGYESGVGKLKKEINQKRKQKNILTYEQASRDQRVRDDLELIRQRMAYSQKLEEITTGLSGGIESLITVQRKVEADLDFIQVFDKTESEKIVQEITQIIGENRQFIGDLVIKVDQSRIKSAEEIWNEIVKQK